MRVRAVIASTMGTARRATHGSWRPVIERGVGVPSVRQVVCSRPMEEVGLKAVRKVSGAPVLMPPRRPPQWFVCCPIAPASVGTKGSLADDPYSEASAKPSPISKPQR